MNNFIAILREVHELESLKDVLPEIPISPYDLAKVEKNMDTMDLEWNANDFLKQYQPAISLARRGAGRGYAKVKELRVLEYGNTMAVVNRGWYLTEKGKEVMIERTEDMAEHTRFYFDAFSVDGIPQVADTEVEVVNADCLAEAVRLIDGGYKPAVLNMASASNPGGGVMNGSGAQEETLFRRTNLFRSLYKFASYAELYGIAKSHCQYPLNRNFGGIYTPNATLFRDNENCGYRLMERPCKMSFISVAGVNRPALDGNGMIVEYLIGTVKNKMRTIFRIGLDNGHDSLVLGALGCGAFKNPPQHIARLFHGVMEEKEFYGKYRLIVFAILDDHNAHHRHNPNGNYLPFLNEFSK